MNFIRHIRKTGLLVIIAVCFLSFINKSQAAAPTAGLTNYFSFDDGTAGNGTFANGAATGAGKLNGGIVLDGADDEVVFGNDFLGVGPLTVSAWIKVAGCTTAYCTIIGNGKTIFAFDPAYNRLLFISDLNTALVGSPAIFVGQWVHVAGTRDASGNATIYINGSSVATGNSGTPVAGSSVKIGMGIFSFGHFNGSIDEVRVYNRQLSTQEIGDIYADAGGVTQPPPPPPDPEPSVPVPVTPPDPSPEPPPTGTPTSAAIPSGRVIDWRNTGVPGGIPNRTTICSNFGQAGQSPVFVQTVTVAQINSAISGCTNGVVYLNPGTYSLTGTINLTKNNVTLRGAGPTQTILKPVSAQAIFIGGSQGLSPYKNITNNSAQKGSRSFTVNDISGITVGAMLEIQQGDDPDYYWDRWGIHNRTGQFAMVTGVSGNTVTIEDPLVYTFSIAPTVRYFTGSPTKFSGIEDLGITAGSSYDSEMINMWGAYATWVKNVETSWGSGNAHIQVINTLRGEIRDSYIHDTYSTSDGYGLITLSSSDTIYGRGGSTGLRFENNILSGFYFAMVLESEVGGVFSYNYFRNTRFIPWPTDQIQDINVNHGAHGMMNLFEGNNAVGLINDGYHGSTGHQTLFRNNFSGKHVDANRIGNIITVNLDRFSYYHNVVGNVLGSSNFPPASGIGRYEMTGQPNSFQQSVIYRLGYPNLGNNINVVGDPPTTDGPDPKVKATLLRAGNYDYFHNCTWDDGANRCLTSGEVSGLDLSSSLYLSGRPSWFGNIPFPPVGPDVSGLVNKIPAQVCYEQGKMPNCLMTGGGTPPPPTGPILGDFNSDGLVNSIDLSLMSGSWNKNVATYDLNHDGIINTLDYTIMVRNWTA